MFALRRRLAQGLHTTGTGSLVRRLPLWNGLVVLTYHRVGDPAGSAFDHALWSATPAGFDEQVRFLKLNCDVIGPPDVADVVLRRRGRFALITFDDGYRDNYENALPVLRSHNVPAVFFVSTGFIDRPRLSWWDEIAWMVRASGRRGVPRGEWLDADVAFDEPTRERAVCCLLKKYKSLPGGRTEAYLQYVADATGSGRYGGCPADLWMTWDMLRVMRAAGMEIGGHTVNHPILARLTPDDQAAEISGCGRRIAEELGAPMSWFSYPVGKRDCFNQATRDLLRENGVRLGFSFYGGTQPLGVLDQYDVPRVTVERDMGCADFAALLTLPRIYAAHGGAP